MKTTLKLLLTLCLFLTTSYFIHAQDEMVQLEETILKTESSNLEDKFENETLSPKQVYINHTQLATDQFIDFLAINITYPENLKKHCVEGEVIVEVLISKNGKIKEAKIFKSLHDNFDQLVLTTLQKMKRIDMNNLKYKGARRLRVPVSFTLQ